MTPKARSAELNPFDLLHERNFTSSGNRSSAMGLVSGGDRSMDRSKVPSVLLTPGYAKGQMSTLGQSTEPTISKETSDFLIKLPPPKQRPEPKEVTRNTGSARGCLRVEIIEGRDLDVASQTLSHPYAVLQFEKNEYIGKHVSKAAVGSNPVWNETAAFDVTMENRSLHLSVYDRIGDTEELIGACEIFPRLFHQSTTKRWYTLYLLKEDVEEQVKRGEVHIQTTYERLPLRKLSPRDFELLKLIGRGTFGRVFQVRKKDTKRIYAMKVLSKREIALKKEVTHTMGERKILEKSQDCPFLVGLKFSFQSETELFFVTDYKSGGELFWHLQREGRFTEGRAKFYVAELVLALEHLHKFGIIYRDLIAPEILLDEMGYSKLVDFWSLGVLLFEMCCGWSPFYAEDTQQMYRNICFGKIKFPRGAISDAGKQFVKGLLNRNPKHRLGAHNDAQDLKSHVFFNDMDWDALSRKRIPPVFKPLVDSNESVANFDPEFTNTNLHEVAHFAMSDDDTVDTEISEAMKQALNCSTDAKNGVAIRSKEQRGNRSEPLSSSVQEKFRGFSYSGTYEGTSSAIEQGVNAIDWGREQPQNDL